MIETMRKGIKMSKIYNTSEIQRMIAKKADFTIGDVRIMMKALSDVIYDVISEKNEIYYQGFFTLRLQARPARIAFNSFRQQYEQMSPYYRTSINTSTRYKELLQKLAKRDAENGTFGEGIRLSKTNKKVLAEKSKNLSSSNEDVEIDTE